MLTVQFLSAMKRRYGGPETDAYIAAMERYTSNLAKKAQRMRDYRASLTNEQREVIREKERLRKKTERARARLNAQRS